VSYETIANHLEALYGAETAQALLPRIEELGRRHSMPDSLRAPRGPSLALDQEDALLITYGDQVRASGQSPLRTLGEFCAARLKGVLSGIHILPFYPFTSDDGFSVVDYRAVDPALGTWQEVESLGHGFDLMFDAVFNHISSESAWFQGFLKGDPVYRDYVVVVEGDPDLSAVIRPRALPLLTTFTTAGGERRVWTTFSPDQVDVNVRHPEVLLELLDVLLEYVAKGARFIRLDAIAFLWKEPGTTCLHLPQTHRIIRLMRALLDEVAPQVVIVTETNVPHADNISYFGDGRNEAQLVYNFALPPLVLHALLTGDGSVLTRWAQGLKRPSESVTYLNFLASHDGIGLNPARGILPEAEIQEVLVGAAMAHGGFVSYKNNPDSSQSPYELNINFFDALSDPFGTSEPVDIQVRRFLVAQSIMLSLAGMPGIYFHSLFGSRGDRVGAERTGIPRRINRQKLTREELDRDLGDPHSLRAKVFGGFQKLLSARRSHAAFHPAGGQVVLDAGSGIFAVAREARDGGERMLCLHNLTGNAVRAALPEAEAHRWGEEVSSLGGGRGAADELGPYEVRWLRATS